VHVVIDAFAVKPGSAAITLENILIGWAELDQDDQFTVLVADEVPFVVGPHIKIERVRPPVGGILGKLWLRSFGVRSSARRLGADAVLGGVTASAFVGAPCPHGVIVYDLRHEFRKHQFSWARRAVRRISYAWSFLLSDAMFCISRRTRDDLIRNHRIARGKAVEARYGSDHVDHWPDPKPEKPPYALAFGQFSNKNVEAVLGAWALFSTTNSEMTLRLVAMSAADRVRIGELVDALGIADRVELMGWLDDEEFQAVSAHASLVVFPSDFEGFGLPAIEALRMRIPLVVSDDRALAEVTGGHAIVAADLRPQTLAAAMTAALELTPEQLEAGRLYSEQFKWQYMARAVRDTFAAA
jgi:glycosyltransferase involved in cell wall biosynthesis